MGAPSPADPMDEESTRLVPHRPPLIFFLLSFRERPRARWVGIGVFARPRRAAGGVQGGSAPLRNPKWMSSPRASFLIVLPSLSLFLLPFLFLLSFCERPGRDGSASCCVGPRRPAGCRGGAPPAEWIRSRG